MTLKEDMTKVIVRISGWGEDSRVVRDLISAIISLISSEQKEKWFKHAQMLERQCVSYGKEVEQKDKRIADLETENKGLHTTIDVLSNKLEQKPRMTVKDIESIIWGNNLLKTRGVASYVDVINLATAIVTKFGK